MAEVNKVIGPAGYWCKCCAHCESVELGSMDDIPIYICTDPYDGAEKRIAGDETVTCTMFNLANEVPVFKATKVKPIEEDKTFDTLVSDLYKQIQDLKSDNARLDKLYSERDGELKELIKASKRKDELIQNYREKLKKANDENNILNSKLDKLGEYYRTDEKLIDNIQKVIFPQEEGSDYAYSYEEILNKVKDLKVQSDENGTMYEDLKYWKERCHKAETDVTTLNSKLEVLEKKFRKVDSIRDAIWNEKELNQKISDLETANKGLRDKVGNLTNKIVTQQSTHYKQCSRILELETMVSKLQSGEYDDILAKDIEIKSLRTKYEDAMTGWKDAIDTNDKQIEEFTRRYIMIAKKLNDIHDILKEESDNE